MAFSDIWGHDQIRQRLQRALQSGELSHAYLFVGPEGVGKRFTATTFAKALCCPQSVADSCDRCSICRRIDQGTYPDLIVVVPQGEVMKISQVRELRQMVALRPFEGTRKVIILDGADRLGTEAANALLKVLEEPPGVTTFLLIASQLKAILPTIVSRCQVVRFSPLPPHVLSTLLQERHNLPPAEAQLLTSLAQGSLGWALQADMETLLQRRHTALQVLETAFRGEIDALFALAERCFHEREEAKLLCETLLSLSRDLAILQMVHDPAFLIHKDIQERLQLLCQKLTPQGGLSLFTLVLRTQHIVEGYGNPQLAGEAMMLEMGRLKRPEMPAFG